ncbi:MAG: PP2C family protein-serine/threonine phosphatase [Terriglobales bacterium]
MPFLFKHENSHPSATVQPVQAKIPDVRGAAFGAFYYGQRRAGDFYDFVHLDNGRVLFCLLDLAGPLTQNRAILCAVQGSFRTDGAELFAGEDINESEAMIELCIRINHTILSAAEGLRSCPTFVGCYDENIGLIWYANAGHTPGLVRDGNEVTELSATGLPLGLFSHAPTDACVVALEPGSALLLISRGVVEGKHKGEEFGLERAKDVFRQTAAESPKELCLTVLNALRQFMNTPPTHDDVTSLALVRA